jgi:hypothetical protein
MTLFLTGLAVGVVVGGWVIDIEIRPAAKALAASLTPNKLNIMPEPTQ